MTDQNDTLQTLAKAQLALATSIAHVIQAIRPETKEPAVPLSKKTHQRRRRGGRQKSDLDEVVLQLLAERPGTSVAELERALDLPDLSRSRLEWSLRRLLADDRIEKSGNTCGARYSVTAQSSSLRVVGS